MAYATATDGARLWYQVSSPASPTGAPLLLIQGLALDHHGWDSTAADFDGRTTIVFDHRGTGASDDRFEQGWSTRAFAEDVLSVLDAAGVDRAHVYGHSMGGRIAQWLAAEQRDRVVSSVLGATTVGDSTGIARPAHASRALGSGDAAELAALFYPADWIAAHPEQAGSVLPAPRSAAAMRAHLASVQRHDGPAPQSIAVPTLVIHGAEDELAVPMNAQLLAAGIPEAELVLLPGARHVYWAALPDAHRRVRDFLARHDHGWDRDRGSIEQYTRSNQERNLPQPQRNR